MKGEYRIEAPRAKLWRVRRCLERPRQHQVAPHTLVYKSWKEKTGKKGGVARLPTSFGMDYGDAKFSTILTPDGVGATLVRRSGLACQQRGRAPRHTASASGLGSVRNHLMCAGAGGYATSSLCTLEGYVFAAERASEYRRAWLWECDRPTTR